MNAQDWAELDYLSGRIGELHSMDLAAMGGDARAIKCEIEARAVQRQRLVNRLSKHLTIKITDTLATAARPHHRTSRPEAAQDMRPA